ncbi:elongation factor P maturation arginine rhamnosyltransferase EarP [Methylotenera sp.]|uniref:elongation factor P maturation arginine rhamnosyltransferase EarP n=1 Tax=Methylotenera sp. TaxID=2051956 RepID=UPI002736BAB7|nr:elongation factor P maturation arginine rhamnosyltransferase EarP [Methylotenera sp.]MDP3210675.1 elongation factor P maturation arginine rhamnosyltransferase EarP [Methylotenera sp.]
MRNKHGNRWDIFCKIVDNYGDIGVCWRLSQQLAKEHHLQVRLFIDDFVTAKKIIPSLDCSLIQQSIQGIEICTWPSVEIMPADVVIETFSCTLPDAYLKQMVVIQSIWINLEYLSAEAWVSDLHARPSPHPTLKIIRHFYFPGFNDDTGGLIRENHITNASYTEKHIANPIEHSGDRLKISLFCYPNAPIQDLLTILQANKSDVILYVPASGILPEIAGYFNKESVTAGEILTHEKLTCQVLPFLSQEEYDQLLHTCDLNFVRGEDSLVRAIWAGKPFIWQPYIQTENTHFEKLDAFLTSFYADFPQKKSLCKAHQCWSAGKITHDVLQSYFAIFPAIKAYTLSQAKHLAAQTDLATKLMIFCSKF